jgi:hypothetical protein
MPIRMTKPSEGGNFSITIEDRFDPQDDHIVELMSMDEYEGISNIDGKPYTSIMWHVRIFDSNGVAFLNMIDQSPYDLVEFSSMSLAKGKRGPSKARLWASAFLGHELTDDECERLAENFDGALVGKRARASWTIETDDKTGSKKLKFALLRPVPRQTRTAAPETNGSAPVAPSAAVEADRVDRMAREAIRETAAERRARLQAELAAMGDETADDDDPPF